MFCYDYIIKTDEKKNSSVNFLSTSTLQWEQSYVITLDSVRYIVIKLKNNNILSLKLCKEIDALYQYFKTEIS